MWNKDLTDGDYELWDQALSPYSEPAIKFAFENWISSGKKFPALADIEAMAASYSEQQAIFGAWKEKQDTTGLRPESVIALLPQILARAKRFHEEGIDPAPPLTEDEIRDMAEIAAKEKAAPEVGRFPNGNAVLNVPLAQASVLRNASAKNNGEIEFYE